jgi:VWFA-related protein
LPAVSAVLVGAGLLLFGSYLCAQEPTLPDTPQPQNNVPAAPAPAPPAPEVPAAPATSSSAANPSSAPPGRPPANPITTVPSGAAPDVPGSPRDQLFTLTKQVNFVLVPVTVKDRDGHLVEGLLRSDFTVLEDTVQQKITFFTSDPFPLSAAVVLDVGLPDLTWKRVRDSLSALVGAFSQFDEVALFTYGNSVKKVQDFTGVEADRLAASVRRLKTESGKSGVPVVGGPFSGPYINGIPVEPTTPQIQTYPKESYVLNDAILAAAQELSKREPARRKMIFVISDGREVGSANSYSDVLRVLLTRQVSVYAVDVGGGGIPGYRDLEKIRIPGQGYGNILPKYASASGGEVFAELNQQAIESAYARATEEARNQYTIGYVTPARPSGDYRSIEVRVKRPNLKVYAKDGYYPLPPAGSGP